MTHDLAQRIAKAGEPSGGVKWTQAERDNACILLFQQAGMPQSSKELSDKAMDAAIEIAAQRNCLRAALEEIESHLRNRLGCDPQAALKVITAALERTR